MINNTFKAVIAIIALSLFTLGAAAQSGSQLQEKTYPVGEFRSLNVSGDFEVTLSKGDYSAKVTVDQVLADSVDVYVRTGVLYIKYNEKDVPKEVKKDLKGKKAPEQVFRAVVYAPQLAGIELQDNVVLTGVDEFSATDFTLKLEDKAQLKNLSITASSALVTLNDKSQATLILTVNNDIELDVDGSSVLRATVDGRKLTVKAGGSAKATVDATAEAVSVDAGNRAELTLSGKADSLSAKGDRNMKVDARALKVPKAEAKLSGGELTVKVENTLDVDLSGGAELYFDGNPEMKVRRVVKSTLAPVSEKK